jgi:hypothetical protein
MATKKTSPDHKTIANFRHNNPTALKNVFKDFVQLCIKLDLYGKELVAIDGSKFKAVNSKNCNITKNKLVNRIAHLDTKIDEINKEMDTCDQKEAAAEEKAEKTNNKKSTQETRTILNQHLAELNKQKTVYQEYVKEFEQTGETQKSLTDSDSRLMKQANGSSDVYYNIQTAVDTKNKLIVDFEVTNAPNDFNQLSGMAKKALETLGTNRLSVVVDAGFDSATDIVNCLMQVFWCILRVLKSLMFACLVAKKKRCKQVNYCLRSMVVVCTWRSVIWCFVLWVGCCIRVVILKRQRMHRFIILRRVRVVFVGVCEGEAQEFCYGYTGRAL